MTRALMFNASLAAVLVCGLTACTSDDASVGKLPGEGGSGGAGASAGSAGSGGSGGSVNPGGSGGQPHAGSSQGGSAGQAQAGSGPGGSGGQAGAAQGGFAGQPQAGSGGSPDAGNPIQLCNAEINHGFLSCGAMDLTLSNPCWCGVRVYWDGTACAESAACDCVGADCLNMYPDMYTCRAAQSHCSDGGGVVDLCGAHFTSHDVCTPMDAVWSPDHCNCGIRVLWDGTNCVASDACSCVGADCLNLYTDMTACTLAHQSCTDGGTIVTCGSHLNASHTDCAMMIANGDGGCSCLIGYKWDGTDCVEVGGCQCVGPDCRDMYTDVDACRAAHAHCVDGG